MVIIMVMIMVIEMMLVIVIACVYCTSLFKGRYLSSVFLLLSEKVPDRMARD